eukprot:357938-Chlamydomonas_euryale.AAC.4
MSTADSSPAGVVGSDATGAPGKRGGGSAGGRRGTPGRSGHCGDCGLAGLEGLPGGGGDGRVDGWTGTLGGSGGARGVRAGHSTLGFPDPVAGGSSSSPSLPCPSPPGSPVLPSEPEPGPIAGTPTGPEQGSRSAPTSARVSKALSAAAAPPAWTSSNSNNANARVSPQKPSAPWVVVEFPHSQGHGTPSDGCSSTRSMLSDPKQSATGRTESIRASKGGDGGRCRVRDAAAAASSLDSSDSGEESL